jgi:hypothetical protein
LSYLEKRVKSRFGNRVIHYPLPQTLESLVDALKERLLLLEDEDSTTGFNEAVETLFADKKVLKAIERIFEISSNLDFLSSLVVRLYVSLLIIRTD